MQKDILELPEVRISDWEDRVFTTAEAMLDYLQLYGAKMSPGAMQSHLTHLGATEAQLPALLDMAGRKHILTGEETAEADEKTRIPVMGRLILNRLEEGPIRVREDTRRILSVLYGLDDGIPRSAEEAAGLLGISRERVLYTEERAFRRLRRQIHYKRRRRDFYG